MASAVLLANCLLEDSHILMILCLLRQRIVQCVVCRIVSTYDKLDDNFSIVFNTEKSRCFTSELTHKACFYV